MERLWAPWRREYIMGDEKPGKEEGGCIFCDLPALGDGPENLILHRGRRCYVILNRYPYSNGHLMVVPSRHVRELDALSGEEGSEMFCLAQLCVNILREKFGAQGFNVGLNLGRAAGAGVDEHLHMHIVPRWEGDHNYMTVLGDMRVIPEGLESTYATLRPAFEAFSGEKRNG